MSVWAPPSWATMPARTTVSLQVAKGDEVVQAHDLSKRKSSVLGRQAGVADIVVQDERVSRQHAALVHKGAALYLIDLKSAGGVSVDGVRAKPLEATELKEGSKFVLGEAPFRYTIKGLAPPAAAPSAPAAPPAAPAWTAPSWAVKPAAPVVMYLQENGENVQKLDLSRHASYILGRSAASAKIVVPHDSVSRQHAAIVHGAQGIEGAHSLHVVDLGSTKGTFIDLGRGWVRLPPNTLTLLPPGGRVRLGDCATRLAYPAPAPMLSAPPAAAPPPPVEDTAPRFSSLLSSTLIKSNSEQPGAAGEAPVDAVGPFASDATAHAADGHAAGEGEDGSDEGEDGAAIGPARETPKALKNADFRAAMLPFLAKAAEEPSVSDGKPSKGGKRGKKRRADRDSDDSDGEPAPPVVLDKSDPAGGLVLRKTKVSAKKKAATVKIKF